MTNHKKIAIIASAILIVLTLKPWDTFITTFWANEDMGVYIQLNRAKIENIELTITEDSSIPLGIPINTHQDQFERYDNRFYDAAFWGFGLRTGPKGINYFRLVVPGCCGRWWALAEYLPSLWIDYGLFQDGEWLIFFKPVPHRLTNGYVWSHTFGWSNLDGWYCNFCEEK